MNTGIQAEYLSRLGRYATLIHGNEPPGLIVKLAMFQRFTERQKTLGGRFIEIEPLLYPLLYAIETDFHLAIARLIEPPKRSDASLFKFLDFCEGNRTKISWREGTPSASILTAQRQKLESHRITIELIMGRRDKCFAHLDKKFFDDPRKIYDDYPLAADDVIKLTNCMIEIVSDHQFNATNSVTFHVGEFYQIGVDNMLSKLEAGSNTLNREKVNVNPEP